MEKSADAFRTISEVADDLILPQHVLRFWETRFPQIRPLKRAGGRRYYRPADVVLLKTIRQLLYDDGYTIKGVQRLLKEQGPKGLNADIGVTLVVANDYEPDADRPDADQPRPVDSSPAVLPTRLVSRRSRDDERVLDPTQLDTIHEALGTIEECLRILAATRLPS